MIVIIYILCILIVSEKMPFGILHYFVIQQKSDKIVMCSIVLLVAGGVSV